jgi:glutathione S-transferase
MPNPLLHQINVASSVLSSTLALWRGTGVARAAVAPRKHLKLYDMEASPYCRAVREALTALALDVEIYPCPKGGGRFRAEAATLSGKMQFPLLIDPNTGTVMHESTEIIDYLFQTYGHCATPGTYRPHLLKKPAGYAASLLRGLRGLHYRRARAPKKLLALWSFESSPYSRLVRERLTELELPYLLHNLGKEQMADMGPAVLRLQQLRAGGRYTPKVGGKRAKVLAQHGRVQVPYLEDPNTGTKLYESAAIINYLEREYALGD